MERVSWERGLATSTNDDIALRGLGFLALLIVCCLSYGNALDAGFVYDDLVNITQRHTLRWDRISLANWWAAVVDSPSKRPVALATFGLQYWSGWSSASEFHAVNIAIHFLNSLLVWRFAVWLMQRASGPSAVDHSVREVAGLIVALVFVAHPIQTQSVTYVVQRMNSLAAGAQLACLLFYMAARRSNDVARRVALLALATGVWILGLGAKESAAIVPVTIWLYEWYFERDLDFDFARRSVAVFLFVGVPTLVAAVVVLAMSGYDPMQTYPVKDFTPLERLISQPRVLVFYASQLVWPLPSRLSLLHSFEVSRTLLSPWTTLPAIALVVLALGACVAGARRYRLASFCGLWFFVQLAIESTVVPLALAMEHRLYLALIGPLIALADFVARRSAGKRSAQRAAVALAVLLVGLLSLATHVRNRAWASPEALWSDVLEKYPDDYVARMNLGFHLSGSGRGEEALVQYEQARALRPDDSRVHTNIGTNLLGVGRVEEAIESLRRALELDPDNPLAPSALGRALALAGQNQEAIEVLLEATQRLGDAGSWLRLGQIQMVVGELSAARRSIEIASEVAPRWAAPQEALGILALKSSERDRGLGHFERALQLEPSAALHVHIGLANWPQRDPAAAIEHLERGHALAPAWTVATNNLAWMLATAADPALRDEKRALLLARKAHEVTGGTDPEILSTLAAALAANGEFASAVTALDRAAAIAQSQGDDELAAEMIGRRRRYAEHHLVLEPDGTP